MEKARVEVIRGLLLGLAGLGLMLFVYMRPPAAVDYVTAFYPASRIPLEPYQIPDFVNPPAVALLLWPLGLAPLRLGIVINAGLCFGIFAALLSKRGAGLYAGALFFTSFPFLSLLANGSIEWLPALAFLIPGGVGAALLTLKPQSGILAALAWLPTDSRRLWLWLLPGALLLGLSFIVWGLWPESMLSNATAGGAPYNAAPWPWALPLGLAALVYVLKTKPAGIRGELMGVAAGLACFPYFVAHSLSILMALICLEDIREAGVVWLILWAYAFIR